MTDSELLDLAISALQAWRDAKRSGINSDHESWRKAEQLTSNLILLNAIRDVGAGIPAPQPN